jgi:hypothetical protein
MLLRQVAEDAHQLPDLPQGLGGLGGAASFALFQTSAPCVAVDAGG